MQTYINFPQASAPINNPSANTYDFGFNSLGVPGYWDSSGVFHGISLSGASVAANAMLAPQQIIIAPNITAALPPTVKTGTIYLFQNSSYSMSIVEATDQTLAWGTAASSSSAGTPSASTGVFYIYCAGAQSYNTKGFGTGLYGITTVAPTWNAAYNGWYTTGGETGLVIARFYYNGTSVIDIVPVTSNLLALPLVADTIQSTLDTGASAFTVYPGQEFKIEFNSIYNTGSGNGYYCYVNNDTTLAHYIGVYLYNGGNNSGSIPIIGQSLGSYTNITILGKLNMAGYFEFNTISNGGFTTGAGALTICCMSGNQVLSTITELAFGGATTSMYGIGSVIKIFKPLN